jgi:predicted trehalose synthase
MTQNDFFLLEKVLYEILYELAHRPDWLRVPLAGFSRIGTSAVDLKFLSFRGEFV